MTDKSRRMWIRRSGIALLVLAVAYLFYAQVSTQVTANQATEQKDTAENRAVEARKDAKAVADPLFELCQHDPEVRRRVGSLCDKAAEVKQEPAAVRDGEDGRGISGTDIVDGRLLIRYTDGAVEDKGPVVGQTGQPGTDGRSIIATTIQDGALVLSYSDGTTEDAGTVIGPQGGAGEDGRGVVAVTVSPDFHLIVAYDDETTADAGPLPPGPKGEQGRGIASVAFDLDTCTATVTYTDGTSEPAPMTGCEPDTPPGESSTLPLPGG